MRAKELDTHISKALQYGMVVSAHQKRRAWEHVQRRAGQQMVLPPLEVMAVCQSRLERLTLKAQAWYQHLVHLATDETSYMRAYDSRYILRYGGVSSENRPLVHVFELLRYNLMSPAY